MLCTKKQLLSAQNRGKTTFSCLLLIGQGCQFGIFSVKVIAGCVDRVQMID
jgi:hypothetical protein